MLCEEDFIKLKDTEKLFETEGFVFKEDISFLKEELEKFNSRTKIECICSEGHSFLKTRNNFMNNAGCPVCSNKNKRGQYRKLNIDMVKKNIEIVDGYSLISDKYINGKTKLIINHSVCGNNFNMRYNDFQQGYRCPFCNSISGVVKGLISDLKTNNIIFECEYKIKTIKNERVLPFDFKIDNFIFEYDGQQHFTNSEIWNNLDRNKKTDWIKNEGIKETNFTLIRISYKYKTSKKVFKLISSILKIKNQKELSEFILTNNLLLINKENSINTKNYYLQHNIEYFD